MPIHTSCVILGGIKSNEIFQHSSLNDDQNGAGILSLFPHQNVMGIEVNPSRSCSSTFYFNSNLQFKYIWTGIIIDFVQTSKMILQQMINTKALVQNIRNQTNLNKFRIVLSKILYLNHFKKHCLLSLIKSDNFQKKLQVLLVLSRSIFEKLTGIIVYITYNL